MKFIQKSVMLLLLVLSATSLHPTDICIEEYEKKEGDDEIVGITVGAMRLANCYYEQFFIVRDERDSYWELYQGALDLAESTIDAVEELEDKVATFKTIAIVGVIVSVVQFGIIVVSNLL